MRNLTKGNELKAILLFSLPLIVGNMLQQLYNVVDTLIVGKVIGGTALAAVGSSFALMTFITAITLGFCMGSSVVFSQLYGAGKLDTLKVGIFNSFVFIGILSLIINILAFLLLNKIIILLNIPAEAIDETKIYLKIIFIGIMFTFIYNFFSAVLRSVGNAVAPLIFLAIAAITNIVLDIIFVIPFQLGVAGAALATIIAQFISALCSVIYFFKKNKSLRPGKEHFRLDLPLLKLIASNSILTSIQQSIMNLGILMVQGLVNSFGLQVTAAFAAAVKIDAFAYMPVQDFGNALSTYVAQNYGANEIGRIKKGVKLSILISSLFCIAISFIVFIFSSSLMRIFVKSSEVEIIAIGSKYLKIEGSFYILIGILFILYSFYRGISKPGIAVILTIISLGLRVFLSYFLSSFSNIGIIGIWISIPIGWLLADLFGFIYYKINKNRILE
ncbi:MATE family efflux transporter [Miniphocaeibacter halophilus]|uniref:MATE family efflux transporter n=1 Tax=Miniphocaeibacter halophilus TaxID=2931922 RepID=A0AC61NCX7_9FIRM|nr:MATE family efflux transporter [Miniphocaeibacter halophilus]QQK08678.1 MATE family efflux transporter [Miniphocaeibacter halophilus]